MRVKKFQAKDMPEAMRMVKAELGDDAIILHSRDRHKGLMGFLLGGGVEVTAAVDMKPGGSKTGGPAKEAPKPKAPANDPPPLLNGGAKPPKPAPTIDFRVTDEPETKPTASSGGAADKNGNANPLLELSKKLVDEKKKERKSSEENDSGSNQKRLEKRIISLESQISKLAGMIEKLSPSFVSGDVPCVPTRTRELYNHLLEQDVDEQLALTIATQIAEVTDESDDIWTALKSHLIDRIPTVMRTELSEEAKEPKVIMLVGPTGVGKTTSLAKISAQYRYAMDRSFRPKIVFVTADLYRLAAVEQLQKYAEILGVTLEVTYSPEEAGQAIKRNKDAHLILFDTAGTAQRNMPQIGTLRSIVDSSKPTEVHLVLSATTKYSDAVDVVEHFKEVNPTRLIFTKIDEATTYGTILNIAAKCKIPISYLTTGQNVPEDIEVARADRIAKLLLTKPTVNRSMEWSGAVAVDNEDSANEKPEESNEKGTKEIKAESKPGKTVKPFDPGTLETIKKDSSVRNGNNKRSSRS